MMAWCLDKYGLVGCIWYMRENVKQKQEAEAANREVLIYAARCWSVFDQTTK